MLLNIDKKWYPLTWYTIITKNLNTLEWISSYDYIGSKYWIGIYIFMIIPKKQKIFLYLIAWLADMGIWKIY